MTSISPTINDSLADSAKANAEPRGLSVAESGTLTRLAQWFGVEFHIVDGVSGDLLHCAFDQSARDWSARGQICRAVARHVRAEFIEEEPPLVVMAIPIAGPERSIVAVATFVTSGAISDAQLTAACATLGLDAEDAARWIARQSRWKSETLLSMGQLTAEKLAAETRIAALEKETKDLSVHLSKTYEEISLLYRLTQNLKLSSKDEELGSLALEWLAEVLPVESLALQLAPSDRATSLQGGMARTKPLLVSHGPCALQGGDLTRIIEHFGLQPGQRPLIVNPPATSHENWPWQPVRQMIVVSLCEGNHCFGWLAAINHTQGEEFGTVEASLLSSVAAILGIHSGNAELYHQQREFFASMVRALTSAIDAKDPYTCGHSDRVARVSVRLAEALGCDRRQVETIYLAGLLHDVGKIGIDDNVLRKPGRLTEAEYEHIKSHADIGYRILHGIKQLDEVLPAVLHHHEQWNGMGYPRRLAGTDIPLLARIVAVADSFDAMSSDRPYRRGLSDEALDKILREGAGTQWDATVIDAFFRIREEIRSISDNNGEAVTIVLSEWS